MSDSKMETISVVIDKEVSQRIRVLAAIAAQSRSEWVRDAVDKRLAEIDAEKQPEPVAEGAG